MGFDTGDKIMRTSTSDPRSLKPMGIMESDPQHERFMINDLMFAAMDELIKMSLSNSSLRINYSYFFICHYTTIHFSKILHEAC